MRQGFPPFTKERTREALRLLLLGRFLFLLRSGLLLRGLLLFRHENHLPFLLVATT
jgi:hypothetical protein